MTEDFALAENREDVLKTLVPETQEFYRMKLLHLLNNNFDGKNHKEIEQLLEVITKSGIVDERSNFPIKYLENSLQLYHSVVRDGA